MTIIAPSVHGVQGSVQGFGVPLAQPNSLFNSEFFALCKACRANARVYAYRSRAASRPRHARYARVYAPLHTLHTLHKAVLVRVSAVQGHLTPLARPAQRGFAC